MQFSNDQCGQICTVRWFLETLQRKVLQRGIMELLLVLGGFGFLLAVPFITGTLAVRKGYAFSQWFFAGGPIGLIALCWLPFANSPDLPDWEQRNRAEKGNIVGRNISLATLALVLLRLIAAT